MNIFVKDDYPLQVNIINVKKCILTGYFTQISVLQKNNVYLTGIFVIDNFSQGFSSRNNTSKFSFKLQTLICTL